MRARTLSQLAAVLTISQAGFSRLQSWPLADFRVRIAVPAGF
jgi:hypothetical protein